MGTSKGMGGARSPVRCYRFFVSQCGEGLRSLYAGALLRAAFALAFFGQDMRPGVGVLSICQDRCVLITFTEGNGVCRCVCE